MEEHLEGDLHTGSDVTFHRMDREVGLETRDIPFKSEKSDIHTEQILNLQLKNGAKQYRKTSIRQNPDKGIL